eukprot:1153600-Pelagomonas_calceolata.AAC.1
MSGPGAQTKPVRNRRPGVGPCSGMVLIRHRERGGGAGGGPVQQAHSVVLLLNKRESSKPTEVCEHYKAVLGGHTAGVGGHAAKLMDMGMEQQVSIAKSEASARIIWATS